MRRHVGRSMRWMRWTTAEARGNKKDRRQLSKSKTKEPQRAADFWQKEKGKVKTVPIKDTHTKTPHTHTHTTTKKKKKENCISTFEKKAHTHKKKKAHTHLYIYKGDSVGQVGRGRLGMDHLHDCLFCLSPFDSPSRCFLHHVSQCGAEDRESCRSTKKKKSGKITNWINCCLLRKRNKKETTSTFNRFNTIRVVVFLPNIE